MVNLKCFQGLFHLFLHVYAFVLKLGDLYNEPFGGCIQSINQFSFSYSTNLYQKTWSTSHNLKETSNWAPRASKVRHWPGKPPCKKKPRADPDSWLWVKSNSVQMLSGGLDGRDAVHGGCVCLYLLQSSFFSTKKKSNQVYLRRYLK